MSGLIIAAALASALSPASPLQPTANWSIDYSPDGCTLQRPFGVGADQRVLGIQPTPGILTAALTVRAPAGVAPPRAGVKAAVTLGPSGTAFDAPGAVTQLPDGGWSYRLKVDRALLDALPSATRLDITARGSSAASLSLDRGAGALAALQACERDLLVTWGVDAERFRPQLLPGQPGYVDLAGWVGNDIYPPQLQREGAQGRVVALLAVNPNGRVARCRAIESSGSAALDTQTCAITARFRYPAFRDVAGKPVAFWTVFATEWRLPGG